MFNIKSVQVKSETKLQGELRDLFIRSILDARKNKQIEAYLPTKIAYYKYKGNSMKYKGNWTNGYLLDSRY